MATTYKTPGVYVEEITKFPPSIAPVETAIPAFIGYTEIAEGDAPGDLNLKPTKIFSLVDYEKFFGLLRKAGQRSMAAGPEWSLGALGHRADHP